MAEAVEWDDSGLRKTSAHVSDLEHHSSLRAGQFADAISDVPVARGSKRVFDETADFVTWFTDMDAGFKGNHENAVVMDDAVRESIEMLEEAERLNTEKFGGAS